MAGPWNGHDYSFYGPPAGPYYEGHLAPEHALPLRPLSTRRPRSRDTRESSSSRRHSLHRNYHSDNEAADEEPWEESSGTNEQTYANPLALVEQSGHTSGTGATNRLHSKPQRPSPAGFRYYSDTWYTGSHPTMPYMQSAPLQGDGHTPYPHGGNFMAQPQPTALQGDAHMPYRHEGNFFDNVPHPPASERGKKKSRIRRMRSSSLGAPIMEHSAERTAPHLRRRSPSPSITEPANIRAPSPPRPFVHRQSSVRVGRSGRERERKPGRTPAQSSHEELDFSSYSSDPESAPPGMKTFRKDRAKKSDSQFRIPGGFPLGESLRPDDSKSESSEYQQREQKKWKKKRSSQVPSQSPGRTTASTSSASGVLGVKHYQYRPLESMQFRLIKILPAKMSTIRCEIFSASLQKPPPYVAVSYAWGDPDDTRKIVLRDPETSTAVSIPVAVSLYGALKALRQKQEPAMIWVDYLCIDVRPPTFSI